MGTNETNDNKKTLSKLKGYFSLAADKEDEQTVIDQVSSSVVFRGTNLWILICAIFIASLGLNVNSTAVIIGAMLISPLMGPIIGMGVSVGIRDYDLLLRSLKNFGIATLISVITAAVYFFISPLSEAKSELLARTSPTLYDVLIAFFGGAAGVLALCNKSKGQVIPGVAIATALMPPLCTAGYGLATAQWAYFFGAFYLFFINSVFIALATFLGIKLMRFRTKSEPIPSRSSYGKRIITIAVIITIIPAAFMTIKIVQHDVFDRNVRNFVAAELNFDGTQVLSRELTGDTLRVIAVGRHIAPHDIENARHNMKHYSLSNYTLELIQGSEGDSLQYLSSQFRGLVQESLHRQSEQNMHIAVLEEQLSAYTTYDSLSSSLTTEATTLFSGIERITIGLQAGSPVAIVHLHNEQNISNSDRERLFAWIATRTGHPETEIIVRQK